ncbi:MAG: hypothetical protein KatS3mg122_2143 [Caldimonas sp.]|nr:MAG: hypothetical protein KatS3mg122_2143 [Caldimonas sp.]
MVRLARCRLDHDAVELHWHTPELVEMPLTLRRLPEPRGNDPFQLHPVLTMSEGPLFEVELYAFEGTSGSFRLTPHEFDVEIGGERYERCPLERSALALGAEAAKSALELTLPPDHALVRHLLQATLTGEATAVRLRVAPTRRLGRCLVAFRHALDGPRARGGGGR